MVAVSGSVSKDRGSSSLGSDTHPIRHTTNCFSGDAAAGSGPVSLLADRSGSDRERRAAGHRGGEFGSARLIWEFHTGVPPRVLMGSVWSLKLLNKNPYIIIPSSFS